MEVFRRLCHPQQGSAMFGPIRILVMPVRSLIQPVVAGIGDVAPLVFTCGGEMPLDTAAQQLVRNAYTRVDLVMDRGEFAVVVAGIGDVAPLVFTCGGEMPLDTAAQQLVRNAYTRVDLVMDRGEFAVRGGLIDVFPPTASARRPHRRLPADGAAPCAHRVLRRRD